MQWKKWKELWVKSRKEDQVGKELIVDNNELKMDGPYRIIKGINDVNYQVELLFERNKLHVWVNIDVDALKPFFKRKITAYTSEKTL